MQGLFTHARGTLPASAFPDYADVYICDHCGRDITKYLHPGRPHCQQVAIGPSRYLCRCGKKWLSDAAEWDHLGAWERMWRIQDTFVLSLLFSIPSTVLAGLVYLVLDAFGIGSGASITAIALAAAPAVLIIGHFAVEVGASLWRTRL